MFFEERNLLLTGWGNGDITFLPTWLMGIIPEQPEQEALVCPQGGDRVHIHFSRPQRAVTPGQAAVVYDGDTVLGGGTIL